MRSTGTLLGLGTIVGLLMLIAAACGGDDATATPSATVPPQIVEVTREVEVTKEVTVVETVEVTKEVEVEVIKEVIVVATPTPAPTAAPLPRVTRLKVVGAFEHDSADPFAVQPASIGVQGLPFEGISEESAEFVFEPQLAESWETDDLLTWTFHLREGVQFHFGYGEFTTKDVRFTMEQQSREDSRVTEAAKIAGWLESLETLDDYTFTVTSATIDPVLCCDQGMDRGTWGMYLSKDYFDETGPQGLQDRMVGTGPYQFVEHVPGSYFLHEKVGYDHYRINPDFEEVQILTAIEPSTRLAMLLTGEAHLTLLPSEMNAAAILGGMEVVDAAFPSVLLTGVFGGNWIPDPDNPDDPYDPDNPFLNIKVREALNRAVDRKLIQDTILAGRGETQAVSLNGDEFARLTAPLHARFDAEYGFDPDRARELLVEAGYPNGFDTTMVLTPRVQLPGVEDVGEAIGNMWQDIGINVTFEDAEWQSYIIDIVTKKNSNEAAVLAVDWNQPIALYRLIYYSGGCCHIFDDAFLDEKFLALDVADDFAIRDQLFDDVYTHLFDQYATIPLFWVASQFVINPEVIAEYNTSGQRPPRHLEQIKATR